LLTPRSATELVDAAVQLMRRHFRSLALLAALIAIPSLFLGIIARIVQPTAPAAAATPEAMAELASSVSLLGVLALASVCLASVGFGALVGSAANAYEHGRTMDPLAAVRLALRRALALIVGNMLASVLITAMLFVTLFGAATIMGLVLTGVALAGGGTLGTLSRTVGLAIGVATTVGAMLVALLFGARYALITASVVLERRGPLSAMGRSRELVRGNLRHTTAVVGIGIIFYIVTYVTALALSALLLRDMELASTASSVVVVVVYPFIGCLMTVLYFDLRIRREGYDVEQLTKALDDLPPVGGASDSSATAMSPHRVTGSAGVEGMSPDGAALTDRNRW